MDAQTAAEALRQVIEGEDFSGPVSLTHGISEQKANSVDAEWPYSIATNAEHAVFWNRIWLARLEGTKRPDMLKDWRTPAPNEWPRIRRDLVETLERAHEIASAQPFEHAMKSDSAACKTLLAMAVHTAYHLGQINLLKRMSRKKS